MVGKEQWRHTHTILTALQSNLDNVESNNTEALVKLITGCSDDPEVVVQSIPSVTVSLQASQSIFSAKWI